MVLASRAISVMWLRTWMGAARSRRAIASASRANCDKGRDIRHASVLMPARPSSKAKNAQVVPSLKAISKGRVKSAIGAATATSILGPASSATDSSRTSMVSVGAGIIGSAPRCAPSLESSLETRLASGKSCVVCPTRSAPCAYSRQIV